jgi:branched-chain amino acid aminotransferase
MNIFYINGNYVPEDQAMLPVRDLSILRGYGAFDYLRTYGGQPYRLEANLARLRKSCEILELPFPWADAELTEIIQELLRRNADTASAARSDSTPPSAARSDSTPHEFSIRLVVTGGISSSNILPDGAPSLIILAQEAKDFPAENYANGVKIISVDLHRLFPNAKSTLYTPAILAQKRAKEQGAIEAFYTDEKGNVLEATTSNLFAFFGNKLVTPPLEDGNILAGVTRMTVLELAQEHFKVEIRPLSYEELLKADEVFLSSANKEVMPVVQVDEHRIGDGKPGEGTRQLLSLFHDKVYKRVGMKS